MKKLKTAVKILFITVFALDITIFSMIGYLSSTVGKNYKIERGKLPDLNTPVPVTAESGGSVLSQAQTGGSGGSAFDVDLKMFGIIPFSSVRIEVVDEMHVAVLGQPFGIKLYTEGVLVIELGSVETADGKRSPAKSAGLRTGDYIRTANGAPINCNEDLSAIVADSGGKPIRLEILRSGKKQYRTVTPAFSQEKSAYCIGLWVRDSTAGIGTLTFYSPSGKAVCGLGHGICDDDTGTLMTVDSGEMVTAKIVGVRKGKNGEPGELKGNLGNETLASITANSDSGIFGTAKGNIPVSTLTEVALKQEVRNGKAQILCTVDGDTPKLYRCTVKKRSSDYRSATRNMTVTVTDPELLKKTGGIVQGMSGSPIIQNGKLIGAITHVLVDDPTTGYAIFAENMLKTAQGVASENKLKDAS